MPSTRSGASYNPSSSSQKGHRREFCRSQSVTERQGSVDDSQSNRLVHSEADNTVLHSNKADTAIKSLSGYIESQLEGLQQSTAAQKVPDPCRSVENCMNSYMTVRKYLEHPNTCKLLNGWHPFMEKKNMMLLTEEWSKNNPPPPKQVQKTAPVARSRNSNVKKQPQAQRQGTRHKTLQTGLQNPKDSAGCHGKFISDGQNIDGITEKGGSHIEISEMISYIFDAIPEFYEAMYGGKVIFLIKIHQFVTILRQLTQV
ncbi:hypothetical protein O181_067062 [Austropuccinia psidii MF-1]|uniref:Uncharacterized protein n=1 Tax=Austropuccinia psidii MF-1 TaxID=1389203 RepID=A0A9Q3EWM0_9BASI|nr:hypothetical protein [Austropuccinia psidii MF-1]